MREILSTTPTTEELPPRGSEQPGDLQKMESVAADHIITELAQQILSGAGDVGMPENEFFENLGFKGLAKDEILAALESVGAPVFCVNGQIYWIGS